EKANDALGDVFKQESIVACENVITIFQAMGTQLIAEDKIVLSNYQRSLAKIREEEFEKSKKEEDDPQVTRNLDLAIFAFNSISSKNNDDLDKLAKLRMEKFKIIQKEK